MNEFVIPSTALFPHHSLDPKVLANSEKHLNISMRVPLSVANLKYQKLCENYTILLKLVMDQFYCYNNF